MAGGGGGGGGGGGVRTPEAATFVVSPTPGVGDYTTIAAGISALPASGGFLLLREGDFPLNVTADLVDKNVKFVGCGRGSTRILLQANAVAAFTVPDGLTAPRTYQFEDLSVVGTGLAGQKFIAFEDTGGFGNVVCRNVYVTGIEKPFDYAAYDQTFTRLTELACWGSTFVAPALSTATLLKSVQPAGTYNGAIEARFYGCSFYDPETGDIGTWKLDGEFDLMLEGCSDLLQVKDGSAVNGFKFTDSGFWIENGGTCTFNGTSWGNWFDGIQGGNLTANSAGMYAVLVLLATVQRPNIVGCVVRNIRVESNADRSGFTGNAFQPQAQNSANQPDYGLVLKSGATRSRVVGNSFNNDSDTKVNAVALVRVESSNCVLGQNVFDPCAGVLPVEEAGAADGNVYSGNRGFAGSTVTGTSSVVYSTKYGFTVPGNLTMTDNALIPWLEGQGDPVSVATAQVKTAPVTTPVTVDVKIYKRSDGSLVSTLGTVTIAAGALQGTTTFATPTAVQSDQVLAAEVTGIGTGTVGANLTVIVS